MITGTTGTSDGLLLLFSMQARFSVMRFILGFGLLYTSFFISNRSCWCLLLLVLVMLFALVIGCCARPHGRRDPRQGRSHRDRHAESNRRAHPSQPARGVRPGHAQQVRYRHRVRSIEFVAYFTVVYMLMSGAISRRKQRLLPLVCFVVVGPCRAPDWF